MSGDGNWRLVGYFYYWEITSWEGVAFIPIVQDRLLRRNDKNSFPVKVFYIVDVLSLVHEFNRIAPPCQTNSVSRGSVLIVCRHCISALYIPGLRSQDCRIRHLDRIFKWRNRFAVDSGRILQLDQHAEVQQRMMDCPLSLASSSPTSLPSEASPSFLGTYGLLQQSNYFSVMDEIEFTMSGSTDNSNVADPDLRLEPSSQSQSNVKTRRKRTSRRPKAASRRVRIFRTAQFFISTN